MNLPVSDLAKILDRCRTGIAAVFRQSVPLCQWSAGLAELLGELQPQAPLTACLLRGEGTTSLIIRPARQNADAGAEQFLESQWSALDPLGAGVQELPTEALPGLRVLAAASHDEERSRGFLVIGLDAAATAEERARAEAVLLVAAQTVALRWRLEAVARERAELARFALVGQAFAGLAHDLNNALNSMMLQTSVVQLRVDPQVRQELAAIRQHGAQAAGLVRSLQHVVQERREQSYEVDLNSVLAEVLEEEPNLRQRLSPRFAPHVPAMQSTHSAVKQLVHLLLEGVCAGTQAPVTVTTGEQQGGAALSLAIADAAPDLDSDNGPSPAEALLWQNLDEVGRQAGQSLLRQLGGTLSAQRDGEGTLVLHALWAQPA